MITYQKQVLNNGLSVIAHTDKTAQVSAVSVLYKVGSRDEQPDQTGLAHLFEHLMFSGSKNAKNYDRPLQKAGGENNAFTNNDFTNYYGIVPSQNLETLLWLESDRMADLVLTDKKLRNQKSVVIEEFKETCLNEPYGDVWHHLAEMAYDRHPYRWPVIGAKTDHIKSVTLENALDFYQKYYCPSNAILCITGPHEAEEVFALAIKWFGNISTRLTQLSQPEYPQELPRSIQKRKAVKGDVPADALYMAFPAYERNDAFYYDSDLLSDILASGRSSRLYQQLVKSNPLFTYIDAYITGTFDKGLLVIEGKVSPGVTLEAAESAVWNELESVCKNPIALPELQKIKNKAESSLVFSELGIMHRAINLSFYEALGDIDLINNEAQLYQDITPITLQKCAVEMFAKNNANILYYQKS